MAWKDQAKNLKLKARYTLTPEQRFFVVYAQWTCENNRPKISVLRL